MRNLKAPKYIRTIGDLSVLWFQNSNNYVILDKHLGTLFTQFQKSSSKSDFTNKLNEDLGIDKHLANNYYKDFKTLIEDNYTIEVITKREKNQFTPSQKNFLTEVYSKAGNCFQINYPSKKVKSIIDPLFKHLSQETSRKASNTYTICHQDKTLYLLENDIFIDKYPEKEYYLLQGKLTLLIINMLHDKHEDDWIGTFHASTITNGKKAMMLIGNSGSGKSTFAAFSLLYGYTLVSDDITPIASKNLKVYNYPAAISIKEGSYSILKQYFRNINELESYNTNSIKGNLRYLPSENTFTPSSYTCNTVLWINYKKSTKTTLETISLNTILKILVPESWLHPDEENASRFIDWLETLKCYKLTYSSSEDIKTVLDQVFN